MKDINKRIKTMYKKNLICYLLTAYVYMYMYSVGIEQNMYLTE